MNIIPFVHEGLGNSSYLVGLDDGRAIAIDPDRSVDRYLRAAQQRGWRIETVLETHLHADFVSGANELLAQVGARLFVPAGAESKLAHHPVQPGDNITMDGLALDAIASPGHTPEHLSYVIRDGTHPPALFSGGSLIVGGAARTDLIAPDMTDKLTRAQYRTLRTAFDALPDETGLYPTHGGGSFCSAGSGGARTSTLGNERTSNPLLAIDDEEEFASWFPNTFASTPAYYFRMRAFNQAGPRLCRDITMPRPMSPAAFAARQHTATVIDTRPTEEYLESHIPGSVSNEFRDAYALWLGSTIPEGTELLFVTGDGVATDQVVDESLLVGYERFGGVLEGGISAWIEAGLVVKNIPLIGAVVAKRVVVDGGVTLDVREANEFAAGHIEGAIHIPLGSLSSRIEEVPRDRPIVTYCGHGERSTTAASILEVAGITNVSNLELGIGGWQNNGGRVVTSEQPMRRSS